MKETYTELIMETVEFDTEDVFATSDVTDGGIMPDDGNSWSPLKPIP